MRLFYVFLFVLAWSCTNPDSVTRPHTYTDTEILKCLDQAFDGKSDRCVGAGNPEDVRYNLFPDLEHGYCHTAGSRIHLYADSVRWALIFEKSGYNNRSGAAEIELYYFGNCIDYPADKDQGRAYITNVARVVLIGPQEFARVENRTGSDMETFELIGKDITHLRLRDRLILFENDNRRYEHAGIRLRPDNNPRKLIAFEDVLRYLNETAPELIRATEAEIRKHIPKDLRKLMTIDKFHYSSAYNKSTKPSAQETYQLIAKVLVSKDTSFWKPTLPPNNHWKYWESGNL